MTSTAYTGVTFLLQAWQGSQYGAIAGQKGATLNMNTNSIDATSKDNPNWKQSIVGMRDWSVDFTGMLMIDDGTGHIDASVYALQTAYINQNKIDIKLVLPGPSGHQGYYTGTVVVTTMKYDAPQDGVVTCNGTLTGDGTLAYTEG